jgi:hypothetical protein
MLPLVLPLVIHRRCSMSFAMLLSCALLAARPGLASDLGQTGPYAVGFTSCVVIDSSRPGDGSTYPERPICAGFTPGAVVHGLVNQYTAAFLKTNLAREPGYQNMLTPGWALTREPYIEFFVTEAMRRGRGLHLASRGWARVGRPETLAVA